MPYSYTFKNISKKQIESYSFRSNSQIHQYKSKEDLNKTKIIFDWNIFSQNGEIESNLICEIESNAASQNTTMLSRQVDVKKEQQKIFPSEFSTFSYQPKFVKPLWI